MKRSFTIKTTDKITVTNITDRVKAEVSGVGNGLAHISIPHTTAAVFLAEDDAELREDYMKIAKETLAPLRPFKHVRNDNPNTEAHVFSSLFGAGVTIVVEEGDLLLGAYQNILLLEMDGPKERAVHVNIFSGT